MSLTSPFTFTARKIKNIIKTLTPSKEKFHSLDGEDCFNPKRVCKIPYGLKSTYQSALCGTAFDYLARFYIARIVDYNRDVALNHLVAERLISSSNLYTIGVDEKSKKKLEKMKTQVTLPEEILCGNVHSYSHLSNLLNLSKEEVRKILDRGLIQISRVFDRGELSERLKLEYNKLLEPIKAYIYGDSVEDNILIEISVVLAKMEHMKRSGIGAVPVSKLFQYDADNLEVKRELEILITNFKKIFLPLVRRDSVVVYNPHFGIGSRIMGGADADIYIDGVLYDFKTTIKNGYRIAETTQLVGYYILDAVSKTCEDERNDLAKYPIERIALYKVRFDEIAYFDVESFGKYIVEDTVKEILKIFLMNNTHCLIPYGKTDEYIEKNNFPITRRELYDYCSDSGADWLEWYLSKKDALDENDKERMQEIIEVRKKFKEYLDNIDVLRLFKI